MRKMREKDESGVLEIKREVLLDCLTALRPGLSATVVEQTSSYLFLDDSIASFNDEIFAYISGINTGFRGTVKADVLYKLVQKLHDDTVSLSFKKGVLQVQAGGTNFGLSTGKLGEIEPLLDDFDFDKMKWGDTDPFLSEGIEICSYYASKDMEEPHLTGVLVDGVNILSSDRYRISWFKIDDPVSDTPFIIPAVVGPQIGKYKFSEISVKDNWVHLRRNNFYLCARMISGVSFAKDMLKPFDLKVRKCAEISDEFVEALDRILILLEREEVLKKEVDITISESLIMLGVETSMSGWIKEKLTIKDGPANRIKIKVNAMFLRDILKHTRELYIETGKSFLFFKSDRFKHVISLQ